jgi:hypothetical protein
VGKGGQEKAAGAGAGAGVTGGEKEAVTQKVAGIGTVKKRKAGKVIGEEVVKEEIIEARKGGKPEESKKPTDTKLTKKKTKKVKLSFDETADDE